MVAFVIDVLRMKLDDMGWAGDDAEIAAFAPIDVNHYSPSCLGHSFVSNNRFKLLLCAHTPSGRSVSVLMMGESRGDLRISAPGIPVRGSKPSDEASAWCPSVVIISLLK